MKKHDFGAWFLLCELLFLFAPGVSAMAEETEPLFAFAAQPEEVADADDEQQHGKPLQNSAAPRVAGEHQQFIDNNGNDENIRNIGKTGAVQHVPEKGLQRLQERCHASSASFSILNDFMRSASPLYNKLPRI